MKFKLISGKNKSQAEIRFEIVISTVDTIAQLVERVYIVYASSNPAQVKFSLTIQGWVTMYYVP